MSNYEKAMEAVAELERVREKRMDENERDGMPRGGFYPDLETIASIRSTLALTDAIRERVKHGTRDRQGGTASTVETGCLVDVPGVAGHGEGRGGP